MWFDDIFLSWFKKDEPIVQPTIVTPSPIITITNDYQISNHFTYGQLVATEHRDLIQKNFDEGKQYLNNMITWCKIIGEPIIDLIGIIPHINSCFRCLDLNKAVGGSLTSQHMMAEAGDTTYDESESLTTVFNTIAGSNIPFGQLIYEFSSWIHVSYEDKINHPNKIGQKFITKIVNGKTEYIPVDKI
jgi:zinc D-Ala-D-Ala carboxypeptidase